jgi:eukaryotic-like serine/threonine-protein kinase
MSPEQARDKKAARTDVFSLGYVLYEMLTLRKAFQGEEVSDILTSVLAREPSRMTGSLRDRAAVQYPCFH